MPKYTIKFMFDWGSDSCVWSTNDAAKSIYGYCIAISALPISDELKTQLNNLVVKHDEALNWDEPNGDLLWSAKQIRDFLMSAKETYLRLCVELGLEYAVEFVEHL